MDTKWRLENCLATRARWVLLIEADERHACMHLIYSYSTTTSNSILLLMYML